MLSCFMLACFYSGLFHAIFFAAGDFYRTLSPGFGATTSMPLPSS
jgi:hypothetical protein